MASSCSTSQPFPLARSYYYSQGRDEFQYGCLYRFVDAHEESQVHASLHVASLYFRSNSMHQDASKTAEDDNMRVFGLKNTISKKYQKISKDSLLTNVRHSRINSIPNYFKLVIIGCFFFVSCQLFEFHASVFLKKTKKFLHIRH